MYPSYVPSTDAGFDAWLANFNTLLTAAPTTYGLIAGDAVIVDNAFDAWHAAYILAVNPATRTSVTIAAKDVQKTSALEIVRPYAVQISLDAGVDPSDKTAIGVNPRTDTATPIGAPVTFPVITVDSTGPLSHTLRFRDDTAPASSRAKPFGVKYLQLFGAASATPIVDQNELPSIQLATKVPVVVSLDAADVGKQMYYAGRWVSPRGELGPWSAITTMTVANAA